MPCCAVIPVTLTGVTKHDPIAAYAVFPGPWGPIHVAARAGAIVAIEVLTMSGAFVNSLERRLHGSVVPASEAPAVTRALLGRTQRELYEYLAAKRQTFGISTALVGLSEWDRLVLEGVRQIPYGRVTSYGRLARLIGRPGAARAVGGAVGRNPIGIVIPCHRVIAGDGSLGGYGGDWHRAREQLLGIKRDLLSREATELPAIEFVG